MITDVKNVSMLPDGTVVVDATGAAWQLEEWRSAVTGTDLRERWWFTVGVKTPVSDEELVDHGPVYVIRRGPALRSA